jgi:pimeloyl-ACP methyl ester carboxylesterase
MPVASSTRSGLYYESVGTGHPVVLIPGFASGAWSWAWQTADLAKHFRVITFDPRGISNSASRAGGELSIEQLADDVEDLLDTLAIGSAHVVGISFGGFVAQEFAIKHPNRIDKLVLACTSFGGPNHVPAAPEVYAAFGSTDGLNSPERIRRYLSMAFSPAFADVSPDTVERFCTLREQNTVPEDIYRQQLIAATRFNVEERLGQVKAPVLVVTADKDMVVPMKNSENLVEKLPNAKLAVLHDTGHMGFIEKAGEFNRLLTEFLSE